VYETSKRNILFRVITKMLYYFSIFLISLHIHYSVSVFNFEELQSLHFGIDISDTPLLRQEVCHIIWLIIITAYIAT